MQTVSEQKKRFEQVHFWLVEKGFSRQRILHEAGKEKWEATERQIDTLIQKVVARLAETRIEPESEYAKAYERLNYVYAEATKVQDFKTALAAQKELNRLLRVELKNREPKDGLNSRRPVVKLVS